MNKGNKSTVLSANVGREHVDKFTRIHKFLDEKDQFFYVRKQDIFKQMIDEKYSQLFEQ